MAMNIQRKTSNIANIIVYDAAGNIVLPAGLTITGLNTAGFVKTNASGVFSIDTAAYITLASAITGYTAGTNTALAATDTLLAALGKIQGQINARGTGSVTSVALSLPAIFTVSGSPVTTSGTLTAALASQTANQFFAAPNGSAGAPVFRAIVAADVPTLNQNTTGSAGSVTNAVTFNNGGAGDASGTTYNGSAARTISYNTLGAAPLASPAFTGSPSWGNTKVYGFTRTVPTVVNDIVELGSSSLANGGGTFTISIVVPSSGFSVSKQYLLPINFAETAGAWEIANPIADGGVYSGNNYDLDINVNGGVVAFRLRRTAGTTAGVAFVSLEISGSSVTFTESSATASVTAPTAYYKAAVITQRDGAAIINGNLTASQFIRSGGTAAQFLKADGSIDSNTYITGNQSISLSGDISGTGTTAITTTLATITQSTGSSFVKITLDTKGRVTGNTAVAASDLHATYGSQTANTFYAAPNGSAGNPTFRAIVAADIPTLNYQAPLNGTGFVKATGTTISYDNSSYSLTSHTHYIGTTQVQATSANQALTGITGITFVAEASDAASITTTISSTSTFFDFNLADDNNNDEWRWRYTPSGATVYNAMRLVPVSNTAANLNVSGTVTGSQIIRSGGTASQFLKADGTVDSSVYITGNQSISVTGDVTGSGTTAIALTLATVNSNIGTFNNVTVNAKGLVTAASNVSYLTGNQSITISGDGSGSGTTAIALTLATVNSNIGTFNNVTVNAKGLVTAASNVSYLTGNQSISLTGEATGSGATSISVTLTNSAVIGKVLTGLNITGGTVAATDSILTAFGKLQNQVNGLTGGVTYQGTWNASTNTPTLASSTGTKGFYYVVSVAGTTALNGVSSWSLGDWAIYNGTAWEKVDNTDAVVSVNGFTGTVSLSTANVSESGNLYYTDARARAALSFTAGSGAYNSTTGAITIPTNTNQLTNGAGFITGNQSITVSGDASGSGTTAITLTLATVNSNTGTFNNVTVNAKGLVTAASNVSYLTGNQSISLSGDVSGSGTTSITTTLATVTQSTGANFVKITLDTKGRVTGNTAVGSGDITTALGYTPYNSTNPSGYTSNTGTVTSVAGTGTVSGLTLTGTVTSSGSLTLGGTLSLTAANVNAVGAITNNTSGTAGSTPTLTSSGSLTTQTGSGNVNYTYALTNPQTGLFAASDNANSILTVNRHPGDYYSQLGFSSNGNLYYRNFVNTAINTSQAWQTIWTSSSLTNLNQLTNGPGYITSSSLGSYLPLAGGTMTGPITLGNNVIGINVGDDATISDKNIANTVFVAGIQNTDRGYINFSATSGNSLGAVNGGALTWNGNTIWHAGNLTNLNQLTNGPGYITGYSETDTLASVTARGSSTTAGILVNGLVTASGLANTGNSGGNAIVLPAGGSYYAGSSSNTGAIAITLPKGMGNAMIRMTIKIYEYTTGNSFEVNCGGYMYPTGNTWANNPFAYIVGKPGAARDFTVRFGYTAAGKGVIYIGETTSTWSYLGIHVTDVQVSYSDTTMSNWNSGWTIGYATSFENVTATQSNTQVGKYLDGYERNQTGGVNTIVQRDENGYIQNNYFYTSGGGSERNASGMGYFAGFNSSDYYIRSYTPAAAAAALGLGSMAYESTASYYNASTSDGRYAYVAGGNASGTWNINVNGSAGSTPLVTIDNAVVFGRSGLQFAQSAGPAGNTATSHQTPTNDWWHVIRMNHANNVGYYADLAVSMTTNLGLARRVISGGGQLSNWVTILDALNYNSYAPTLTGGGASGTWGISISGNAATATSATSATYALRIVYNDGPRDLSDRLPNSFARTVNFDFVYAGTVGGTGNYGGVMTYNPWTGTTESTGDSSYQLAFINETSLNGTGLPGLRLRKGIDTTWGSWYTLLHAGNYSSYALPISGGTVTGQMSINKQDSINTTTPGVGATFGLHFGGQTTADSATGITFSAGNASAANANAGIYVQGSGAYGSRMYIATTDSYATGSKTAISINESGYVTIVRAGLTAAGDITAYSDIRLKENILTVENALEKVTGLRGVTYNRKDNKDTKRHLGVIAQEVEKVLPEVVKEDEDGMKHVAYGNIVGVLIEAIKEQQAQIEDLKKQIEFLAENR